MSRINFNTCCTLADVERQHARQLVGKVLLQAFGVRPEETVVVRTPIFACGRRDEMVTFETEDVTSHAIELAFPAATMVITSVEAVGDIWWPRDHTWFQQYSIDDLGESDLDVDSFLRETLDLPIAVRE